MTILKAQWSPNPDVYPHFTVSLLIIIFDSNGDVIVATSFRFEFAKRDLSQIGNMNRSVDLYTHKVRSVKLQMKYSWRLYVFTYQGELLAKLSNSSLCVVLAISKLYVRHLLFPQG